jgi:phosphatidyl-myo-inositol alpha-mannosyltransferase
MLSTLITRLDATDQAGELRRYGDLARPVVSSLLSRLDAAAGFDRVREFARPMAGSLLAGLDAAIAVSNAARSLAESYGVSVDHIIPNGVDTRAFERRQAGDGARVAARRPTVLFFSRLDERKGLDVLLRAMPAVAERVREARVIVAGNFVLSDERATRYRQLAATGRVDCEFIPSPSNEEKVRIFTESTVLVAPALGQESFGIILAEAMAAGLPVVASDIQGYRDVLEGGRLGVLVRPGDSSALADGIVRLLTDPAQRTRFAVLGRDKAASLSWEVVASRVADVYAATARERASAVPAADSGAGL